jgi:hypothetical protein
VIRSRSGASSTWHNPGHELKDGRRWPSDVDPHPVRGSEAASTASGTNWIGQRFGRRPGLHARWRACGRVRADVVIEAAGNAHAFETAEQITDAG